MRTILAVIAAAVAIAWSAPVLAHGGGLNSCGCHFNRKTGECHCHQPNGNCSCECAPAGCRASSSAEEIRAPVCEAPASPKKPAPKKG